MSTSRHDETGLTNAAPHPAHGRYADGFGPVARCFADQLARGDELGAGLTIYHQGACVVDVWGGTADVETKRAWDQDTRVVVFSVSKGLAAMAMHLLAERGAFAWDDPVAKYWPEFASAGKDAMTIATLLEHRGGLPYLDAKLTLRECATPQTRSKVAWALAGQKPAWRPGTDQGYHAITFGLYLSELFERIAGEPLGPYLTREWFDVVGSDARLGTPAELDTKHATLYAPNPGKRVARMVGAAIASPDSAESRITRSIVRRGSIARRAFSNPSAGPRGPLVYNDRWVRREAFAWASATGTADGIARAYLPFSMGGRYGNKQLFKASSLHPLYDRRSWSECDHVLQKPVGWSHGFLKEQRHVFSPNHESFGHAGMGGALGWADPIDGIALGYVMNKMDWRVRSPRILALCHALYDSEPLCQPRR